MSDVAIKIERIFHALANAAYAVLAWAPPLLFAFIYCTLLSLVFVLAYRVCSPQAAIRRTKRSLWAAIFEAIVFRRDSVVALGAERRMFRGAATYLFLGLLPVFILAIPGVLLIGHAYVRAGVRPLNVGERVMLHADFRDRAALERATVTGDPGLKISTPVRVPSKSALFVEATALRPGAHKITISPGENSVFTPGGVGPAELVIAATDTARITPYEIRSRGSWLDLFVPTAWTKFVQSDDLVRFGFTYPERDLELGVGALSWIVTVIITVIAIGFVWAKLLNVEI